MSAERCFLAKVASALDDECWLWTGAVGGDRYGRFQWNGRTRMAHHVSWEMFVGLVPEGLVVMHRCDVPLCVNPAHLAVGTQSENILDCVAKGRHARKGGRYPRDWRKNRDAA